MAIEFISEDGALLLIYEPMDGTSWVHERLKSNEPLTIKGTFHLRREHLVEELPPADQEKDGSFLNADTVSFRVARLEGEYFTFDKAILSLDYDLLIHRDVQLTHKSFTAEQKISIFKIIADLRPARIVIGGSESDAIPETDFNNLVNNFPSGFELRRYALARVSSVVRDFVETKVDGEQLFRRYVAKRIRKRTTNFRQIFQQAEIVKYRFLHGKLVSMLNSESTYNESAWQAEILQIILLINPKYIKALREAPVKDTYRKTTRKIDLLLIDASGNVDIVEIKQPFDKCIVTNNQYRDNYIPLRELSGTVMQIEKYVFYLNKWGQEGEKQLTQKYKSELPRDFSIKVTNPGGIVIMGRDNNLTQAQRQDFEVVKRKYKNIIDIITYDDLLRRLDFIVQQLEIDI
jgi:Shedu protein SduA, C-terminal